MGYATTDGRRTYVSSGKREFNRLIFDFVFQLMFPFTYFLQIRLFQDGNPISDGRFISENFVLFPAHELVGCMYFKNNSQNDNFSNNFFIFSATNPRRKDQG
jgi:hypothetical protein